VKFNYNNDTYIRFGDEFENISVAWQYSWLGRTGEDFFLDRLQ
jgi:hypothetical protein